MLAFKPVDNVNDYHLRSQCGSLYFRICQASCRPPKLQLCRGKEKEHMAHTCAPGIWEDSQRLGHNRKPGIMEGNQTIEVRPKLVYVSLLLAQRGHF
jgi:hypothetical protein